MATHTRIYWELQGGHVHTEFWSGGSAELAHGKNGDLVFTVREWESLLPTFEKYPELFELIDRAKLERGT